METNQSTQRPRRRRVGEANKKAFQPPKAKTYSADTSVWDILRPLIKNREEMDPEKVFDLVYKNDRERIKDWSHKYRDLSLRDAFRAAYGPDICPPGEDVDEPVISELRPGDRVDLKILGINKKDVVFDNGNYKVPFATRNNLWRYKKLQEFTPNKPVPCEVTELANGVCYVDILKPMTEAYIYQYVPDNLYRQCDMERPEDILVKDLHMVRGGFIGQAVIPTTSEFVGEDYAVPCFIPGSHVSLNMTKDWNQFEGQSARAFVMNYSSRTPGGPKSLVCSVKKYLQHEGNIRMISMFNDWCSQDDRWLDLKNKTWACTVTGVINSSRKCGVFVEMDGLNINGMLPAPTNELSKYHPGDELVLSIARFEENIQFNQATGGYEHLAPYEVIDGCLDNVRIKPVFEIPA